MAKDFVATIRIQRQKKTTTDDRGRTVWIKPVDDVELELVSTTALQKILQSDDGKTRGEIRRLVAGRKDGVLARDAATGVYQIVSDADLKTALGAGEVQDKPKRGAEVTAPPISEKTRVAADELSLVSTQVLRKVLKPDGAVEYETPTVGKKDKFGGFDPYNNS
jgi:hypothetical protein